VNGTASVLHPQWGGLYETGSTPDSGPLYAELTEMGVEMIAPHHPCRRRKTQDLRKLRRYRRRWHNERLFARMLRCRPL
jgi:hypothetical protein